MEPQTIRTVAFNSLPDDARLWVFGTARPLSDAEAEVILGRVDRFLGEWHAHGHPVVGSRDLRYGRFLLIAADERATGVSGCSTDSLYRVLKDLEQELQAGLLDTSLVFYRDGDGTIRAVSRPDFREMATEGAVDSDTTVFDNTIRTTGDLVEAWEKPLASSWHAKAFLSRP